MIFDHRVLFPVERQVLKQMSQIITAILFLGMCWLWSRFTIKRHKWRGEYLSDNRLDVFVVILFLSSWIPNLFDIEFSVFSQASRTELFISLIIVLGGFVIFTVLFEYVRRYVYLLLSE